MNIELKNLKGTFDFLPQQQIIRNNIINILKKNFEKYGYLPLETPILNSFDLLSYKYENDAEILSEIYKMQDQGKRDIGLRYDLTVPFCKVIGLNKDLTMPFRRYEIGKVFRDGPVKLGRAREFYQCDIDAVGVDGRFIEIEQMLMVKNIFSELNIPIEIKWNNRKLMTGLILSLGISENLVAKTIGLIDRFEKINKSELIYEFNKINIDENKVEELINLFNQDLNYYKETFENSDIEILKDGIFECLEISELISKLNLEDTCVFSPTLARGLSIYTGTIFEFFDKEKRITSSLGGGGRYNKIITEFMDNGQEYPAIGLSFGLEPIYAILSQSLNVNLVDVFIVPMGTQVECLKLATILRENNIKTIIEMKNKKVKKSFEYANKTNIKFVIVVGEDEINKNEYTVKDMSTGEQQTLSLEKLLEFILNNK